MCWLSNVPCKLSFQNNVQQQIFKFTCYTFDLHCLVNTDAWTLFVCLSSSNCWLCQYLWTCLDGHAKWYVIFVPELANGQIDPLLPELGAGPSSSSSLSVEELEANLGVGELSRQSSHTSLSDPLSPSIHDFSDEESDISSDLEVN